MAVLPLAPMVQVWGRDSFNALRISCKQSTCDHMMQIKVLRGQTRGRLRQEVEYMLHKGSSDNAYLLTPPGAVALMDVPYEVYADKFGEPAGAGAVKIWRECCLGHMQLRPWQSLLEGWGH